MIYLFDREYRICYTENMKKTRSLTESTKEKIAGGHYGGAGGYFPSLRAFAEAEQVAYATACRVFAALREEGMLYLLKRKWLTGGGICPKDSPLGRHCRTKLIGVHVKEINNPYISELVGNLQKHAQRTGFQLIVRTSENDIGEEKDALRYFAEAGCAGVVNFPSSGEGLVPFYEAYPLPMVFVGRTVSEKLTSIITDNFGIGRHIAKFLLGYGYTRFLYAGPERLPDQSNERLNGYASCLREQGVPFSQEDVFRMDAGHSSYYAPQLMTHAREAVRRGEKLGIFCQNDLLAYRIIKYLDEAGFAVPEQIGVVGYDNLQIGTLSGITITTVGYDFNRLARRTLETLSENIRTRQAARPVVIPSHVIIRNSTP